MKLTSGHPCGRKKNKNRPEGRTKDKGQENLTHTHRGSWQNSLADLHRTVFLFARHLGRLSGLCCVIWVRVCSFKLLTLSSPVSSHSLLVSCGAPRPPQVKERPPVSAPPRPAGVSSVKAVEEQTGRTCSASQPWLWLYILGAQKCVYLKYDRSERASLCSWYHD